MSIIYRDAAFEDGPALAEMGRRCFAETFGPHFPADDMALHLQRMFGPDGLPAELRDPKLRVRVAEEDSRIAAYLKLAPMSLPAPHEPGALEVKQLFVLEPWQGAGVAVALMDWAVETGHAQGAPPSISASGRKARGRSLSIDATALRSSATRRSSSAREPIRIR